MSVSCEDEYSDMLERVKKGKENVCTIYVQELMAISSESTKVSFMTDNILVPFKLPMLIYKFCQHGKAKRKKDDESENSSEEEQPKKKAKTRKSKVWLILVSMQHIYLLRLK